MDTTTAKRILNARVAMLRAKDPRMQLFWSSVFDKLLASNRMSDASKNCYSALVL